MLFHFQKINRIGLVVILAIFMVLPLSNCEATIQNLPSSNNYFIGREKELFQLFDLLNKNRKTLVFGTSGIGKTQVVKAFAYQNHDKYDIIWWFDTTKSLKQQFLQLAVQLELQDDNIAFKKINEASLNHIALYIKNVLQNSKKSWLLIFDNIHKIENIREFIPETSSGNVKHNLILISQNNFEYQSKLHINSFTRIESLAFLSKVFPLAKRDELNLMATIIYDYPLALAQASAYINTNNISINSYLMSYKKDYMSLLSKEHSLIQDDDFGLDLEKKTINSTLLMSLEKIEKESNSAILLIQSLSLLDVRLVNENILAGAMKYLGKNEEDFQSALRILKRYSLIDLQISGNSSYFYIHDAIKNLVRNKYFLKQADNNSEKENNKSQSFSAGQSNVIFEALLQTLRDRLYKPFGELTEVTAESDEISIATQLVLTGISKAYNHPALSELSVILLELIYSLYSQNTDYVLYQDLSQKFYTLLKEDKINITPQVRARYFFNAVYADFIYKTDEASAFFEKQLLDSLRFFKTSNLAAKHLFLGHIGLIQFYLFTGKFDKGLELINEAKSLLNDSSHPNFKAQFWFYYTWLLTEKGDYKKAQSTVNEFLAASKQPNVSTMLRLFAMEEKSNVEIQLNNIEEAAKWADICYKEAINFFKSENEMVIGYSLLTLALFESHKQNYDGAIRKANNALKVFDNSLGKKDIGPSQAMAYLVLGNIHYKFGDYKKAFSEYMQAEKVYLYVYKSNISEVKEICDLYSHLAELGIVTKNYSLTKKYLKLLIDNFKMDHPNTIQILDLVKNKGIKL